MYTSKSFRPRPLEDIAQEISHVAEQRWRFEKVFLADGNALVLSNARLLPIFQHLSKHFNTIRQISCYALPSDILRKSDQELEALRNAGLSLVYIGVESGDNEILHRVCKGQTQAEAIQAILRCKKAGIKSSVMVLNGLGGQKHTRQHAINTATVLNESQPEFISTLVVSFPTGDNRFISAYGTDWQPLTMQQLFDEVYTMIEYTALQNSVFRSNHASNYLNLKGTLPFDKDRLLTQLKAAVDSPDGAPIRPEWARGL